MRGTRLATTYAQYYKIDPQREGESDYDFRYRVSGILRQQGKLIEAHEAFNDSRYDDPENGGDVITGIEGAMAFILQGHGFNGNPARPSNGERQIDDDFVAGTVAKAPKMSADEAMMLITMLGGK